jgi:hypothetical protein
VVVVVVVQVIWYRQTRQSQVVLAVVVVALSEDGYLLCRCSQQRPTPSAQVLLALQQATALLAVRHYLAHTQKPRGAAAVQTEQQRHRQRAVQVATL